MHHKHIINTIGEIMKFYNKQIIVYTLLSIVIMLSLSFNSASALMKPKLLSVIKIPLKDKENSGRSISKLEIIAAIREKYTGKIEILSIRKKAASYGKNCHYTKIIDSNGEFVEIHIACKK